MAGGAGNNRLSGRRRTHVFNAQIDRRRDAARVRMAHDRRATAGIDHRGNRAAVQDTGLRIAYKTFIIGHGHFGISGPKSGNLET